jgi:4-amino-4-deoxy-L-arabinose transferase-like glycosyltransferase
LKRSTVALTVLLVFASLVIHLSVSWQDFSTLAKNGYLYDDSFYAFQIARNIAEGNGVTFDGKTPTNGFQPLYVFLLVPIYKIFGPDRITPVYAALSLLALLTVATALLLFLIARRYVSDSVALFAAMVWVFSPVVVRQSSNGLETALALFLLAFSVYYYLERIRNNPDARAGQFVKMGLLLGLAVLARVDEVLLALAMALDYLLLLRRRAKRAPGGKSGVGLRGVGIAASTAFVIFLPWAIYGIAVVGSPLQESGEATRFLSVAYAPIFDLGAANLAEEGPDGSFVWAHVAHSLSVLKQSPPVHALYRSVEKMIGGSPPKGLLLVMINVLSLVVLAGFAVWVICCNRSREKNKRGEITFLLLFSALLMTAYSTYVFGVFFFTRYFYPIYFVATIFAACVLQDVVHWASRRSPALRVAAAAAFGLYAAALIYMGFTSGFRSTRVYHFYDIAMWVDQNTGRDETIGVFQGGAIGYLSNRRVVNLDGKVNGQALSALKRGDIRDYIADEGIDIVMDHTAVLNLFLGPCREAELAGIKATRCFTGSSVGAPGWIGFRLDDRGTRARVHNSGPGPEPETGDAHLSD